MSLGADRKKSGAVGLGNFEVRETSPSVGTAFESVGHLEETNLEPIADVEEIIAETGDLVDVKTKSLVHRIGTNLIQTSIDEINLPKNALSKEYAIRYSGMMNENFFQYFCFPRGKFNPSVALGYKNGKRVLPIRAWGLKQTDSLFDIPEYHLAEAKGLIRTSGLQLWNNPKNIYTPEAGTSKVFDISGFERHGTLNSDYETIWQAGIPDRFLRFDGVNDALTLGDILDDDAVGDFIIEVWSKVVAVDGTLTAIIAKKAAPGITAGWGLYRNASNKMQFLLSSAVAESPVVSTANVLQNVWKHTFVAADRDGVMRIFLNGVLDGTSGSVAGTGSATNAHNLYIGRDNTNFGQVDVGGVRIYRFASGGLPSDAATIALNHFNAEKAYYGLA